jgi:hypothetical protein
MLRPTVQSASLSWCQAPIWGLRPELYYCQTVAGLLVWGALWRENGSPVYNCCWSSPAQSFLGPNPAGLVTIFYCLRFETPPTWKARSSYLYRPGTGWSSYTPRHWVPVLTPPTTRRATVEVFEAASTREVGEVVLWSRRDGLGSSLYSLGAVPTEKTIS